MACVHYHKVGVLRGETNCNLHIICIQMVGVMGLVWLDYQCGYDIKKKKIRYSKTYKHLVWSSNY